MIGLSWYSRFVGILFSWLHITCSAIHGSHLRRTTLHQSIKPPAIELDPAMAKGMKQLFTIQRVGLQRNGLQPRSPLAEGHRRCFTAGTMDNLGGNSLNMMHCSDADLTPSGMKPNRTIQDWQSFHFLNNGQIRNYMTGKCIRRVLCGSLPVYDLGPCSEERSATTWTVTKAVANQVNQKQFLGYPLSAVVRDMCNMCGPYQLLQKCKGEAMTSAQGCGEKVPAVGWTKLPSSAIREDQDSADDSPDGVVDDVVSVINQQEEMDGIDQDSSVGHEKGNCGTHLIDGVSEESWFYFLKVGK